MTTSTSTPVASNKGFSEKAKHEKMQMDATKQLGGVVSPTKNAIQSAVRSEPEEKHDYVSSAFIESLERITKLVSSLRSDLSSAHSLAAQSAAEFVPSRLLSFDTHEGETSATGESSISKSVSFMPTTSTSAIKQDLPLKRPHPIQRRLLSLARK